MTMDHGTCNIDVGCSINIQRTDGECENTTLDIIVRAVLRRPVLFSLAPPPPPSPPRSRVDSFISPRISVCPLAFPRSLLILLSLRHSHFVLIAIDASIISSSPSHISSRRTIRPRLSVQSRFFPLRSFPSRSSLLSPFRVSLSPLFLDISPHFRPPVLSFHPLAPSRLGLPVSLPFLLFLRRSYGLVRASPCFSATVCHAVGSAARPTRDDHAWARTDPSISLTGRPPNLRFHIREISCTIFLPQSA